MQRVPPELTRNARDLRTEPTPAERRLWQALRSHHPRFTRQLVVDRFIIDIACRSLKLGIELDGGHHGLQIERDEARAAYLAAKGWTILRFWNTDVLHNLDGVVTTISQTVQCTATHPQPLPCREGSRRISTSEEWTARFPSLKGRARG
jgi:very-short-patch-repair endonuclease